MALKISGNGPTLTAPACRTVMGYGIPAGRTVGTATRVLDLALRLDGEANGRAGMAALFLQFREVGSPALTNLPAEAHHMAHPHSRFSPMLERNRLPRTPHLHLGHGTARAPTKRLSRRYERANADLVPHGASASVHRSSRPSDHGTKHGARERSLMLVDGLIAAVGVLEWALAMVALAAAALPDLVLGRPSTR